MYAWIGIMFYVNGSICYPMLAAFFRTCKNYVYPCFVPDIAIATEHNVSMFNYGSNSGAAEDSVLACFYVVYTLVFGGSNSLHRGLNV
jgi:hypothetical protein